MTGLINGTWGDEPNGVDDLICVRVADFDRTRFAVVDAPPTLRAIGKKERSNRLLRQGDLLIEKSGGGHNQPVGCVVDFDHTFDAVCSNFIGRITVAPGMWSRYWTYVHASLYSSRLNVPAIKQTTGIQNLDTDAYFNQRVPFPPLPQQRAIADYLDRGTARLDALVAVKERVLGLLAEKRRSLITRAVTRGLDPTVPLRDSGIPWLGKIPAHWEIKRLKHVGRAIIGLTFDPVDTVTDGSGILVLRASNVQDQKIVLNDNLFVLKDIPDILRTREGDILICSRSGSRALIGKNALIDQASAGLTFGAFMTVFRSPHNEYIFYIFNSQLFDYQAGAFSTSTINQLTIETLNGMEVPLPPPSEQKAIVASLRESTSRLDRLLEATDQTITLLKERRATLIAAAVTGQINLGSGP